METTRGFIYVCFAFVVSCVGTGCDLFFHVSPERPDVNCFNDAIKLWQINLCKIYAISGKITLTS